MTDTAVFRPADGTGHAASSTQLQGTAVWRQHDIPVQADYDGDGRTDMAVFRPSNAPGTSRSAPPARSERNSGDRTVVRQR